MFNIWFQYLLLALFVVVLRYAMFTLFEMCVYGIEQPDLHRYITIYQIIEFCNQVIATK